MLFRDRREAGERLGEALRGLDLPDPVVLAIPRGGVIVGAAVAAALAAPLDVVVPRKLRAPDNPELAIGAVAHDGSVYLDQTLLHLLGVDDAYVAEEIRRQREEIRRRLFLYRGREDYPSMAAHTVILVDDGIATGATMVAAARAVRAMRPAQTVIAIPVGPPDGVRRLEREADRVVVLETPPTFYAVGQFYEDFTQTTDEEVVEALGRSAGAAGPGPARGAAPGRKDGERREGEDGQHRPGEGGA